MKHIITLLIIALSIPCFAQLQGQALIDSLEAELPNAKGDTNHVNLLNSLSYNYFNIDPDKGIEYGEEALRLGKNINWDLGIADSYNSLGLNKVNKSNYTKALEYYDTALKIYEKLGNKSGVANLLINYGNLYSNQANYSRSLEYYEKSLFIFEMLEDKFGIAKTIGSMGKIYNLQSDYPKAIKCFARSLEINEKLDNKEDMAISLGNLGGCYFFQKNYPKSIEYFEKALSLFNELGSKYDAGRTLGNIGAAYNYQSDYSKAKKYFDKALKISRELGDKIGSARHLGNIAYIYTYQLDYPKALKTYGNLIEIFEELGLKAEIANTMANMAGLYGMLALDSVSINPSEVNNYISIEKEEIIDNSIKYSKQAIRIFEEIGELNVRSDTYRNLSISYKLKGDFKKAYEALEEHQILKDSIFNENKAKEIGKLEAEREQIEAEYAEEEAARIKEEKNIARNRLQYLGIGAVVVAFGVLLLLSGRMKLKEWMARALVFLTFIFLFEFILVIIDPFTDEYSEGIPIIKFGINMALALVIFPMHQYFEKRVSLKVVKPDTLNTEQILEEFRRRKAEES